ncbi:hypothetical protein [Methanococcoides burtonii]|uniref:Uncharacterized protein n=1 Tax=Methanococcoides burtonii (strain DSM 6242 / NBRC 107633 / OCM 468 / ACE-M) TaxID=259564 RepID=Q12XF5_METBU|nr:hypothetical protein [Methanococcoides burtonii]ABE51871.1 Hypothetical protein Mbur_0928 [Methanococcoides burtonii DSM 6242]
MDTLTTVAIAIAVFLVLIVLTAMELKTASYMHTEKNSLSPPGNNGENGCNTDKDDCNTGEKECNDDERDTVIQD